MLPVTCTKAFSHPLLGTVPAGARVTVGIDRNGSVWLTAAAARVRLTDAQFRTYFK